MTAGTHLIDQQILKNPPRSKSSEVFFLSALVVAGRSMYGVEWDDAERKAQRLTKPVVPRPAGSPMIAPIFAQDQEIVDQRRLDSERLAAITEKRRHAWEESAAACVRLLGAFDKLLQKLLDEEVPAIWVGDYVGGTAEPLEIQLLRNDEAAPTLLTSGRLTSSPPPYSSEGSDGWVFVDAPSLRKAFPENMTLEVGTDIVVDAGNFSRLPDPLKIAISIALGDPSISSKGKGDRERAVADAWAARFPGVVSNSYIKAIAVTLGKPDLDRIRRESVRYKAKRAKT